MTDPTLLPAGDEMMRWITEIVAQGVRRPGYEADRWTEDWAARMFTAFGLDDVHMEHVAVNRWTPSECSLRVWRADTDNVIDLPGFPLPYSASTDGTEGPLARLEDPGARDLRGCLAVSDLRLLELPQTLARQSATWSWDPDHDFDRTTQILPFGPHFQEVMEPAIEVGAAGFVGALSGVPWETCQYYVPYDGVARSIPGMWISRSSAWRLSELMEQAPVRGRIFVSAVVERAGTHNVLGALRGRSDEWVIVASHHDGPWASAVEDGSGIAMVLAQARYWAQVPPDERPHNLLFLLTSGHMVGAAGTKAFVAQHAELLGRVVLELHLEHAARECVPRDGQLEPTDVPEIRWWFTSRGHDLEAVVKAAIVEEDLRRSLVHRPDLFFEHPPTDGSAFHAAGVPIVHFLTAPMYLFDAQDTLDKVHDASLVPVSRAVARIIEGTGSMTAARLRESVSAGTASTPEQ
jgi:hypothetical protein